MNLKVIINQIKGIDSAEIELPIEKGVYAVVGENGCGKSTLLACAACAFFQFPFEQFFGNPELNSSITFELGEDIFRFENVKGKWVKHRISGNNKNANKILKGFYEGSLNYGNRFRNVGFWQNPINLKNAIQNKKTTSEIIRKKLGFILHNNEEYYKDLYFYRDKTQGDIFFYKTNNGVLVDQFHMSTGENLLLTILDNISNKKYKRKQTPINPYILLLDEIEMGLHPSAVMRLFNYLNDVAHNFNFAIYISTHSVEIINESLPQNIIYIERNNSNSIETTRPCYSQKVIHRIYKHNGFDRVILVEDDMSRAIVERILSQERLKNNKLVLTLPCGGSTNVINFAKSILTYNILGNKNSISLVIDGDVQKEAKSHMNRLGIITEVAYEFLPFPSFEKYLRQNLVLDPDDKLIKQLDDYIFQPHELRTIVLEYKQSLKETDNDGKILYKKIESELKTIGKERNELINEVITYLFKNKNNELINLIRFLRERMS